MGKFSTKLRDATADLTEPEVASIPLYFKRDLTQPPIIVLDAGLTSPLAAINKLTKLYLLSCDTFSNCFIKKTVLDL